MIVTGKPVITPSISTNDISKSTFNGDVAVAVYSALIEPSEYSPSNDILINVLVEVGVGVGVGEGDGSGVGVGSIGKAQMARR